jgi:hypothetical protein
MDNESINLLCTPKKYTANGEMGGFDIGSGAKNHVTTKVGTWRLGVGKMVYNIIWGILKRKMLTSSSFVDF